jgi:hypothetical protein
MRPLPHPPDAENDEDSIEMIRGWVVDGELQISLAAWVWADRPEEWGRLLADSACHLADAVSEETGSNREEVFLTISHSLIHYLQHPPSNLDPTWDDLWPYFPARWSNSIPICPAGGTYTIGPVGEKPKCSAGGGFDHSLL